MLIIKILLIAISLQLSLLSEQYSFDSNRFDVFTIGEAGYFCLKIPYILNTKEGTLIAWSEARLGSCSDYTGTDLVMKRSNDGGKTWGPIQLFYGNSTENQISVIGNAAPVQDSKSGRIHVPFCLNNSQILYSFSDDDGITWSSVKHIPNHSDVVKPEWKWLGLGPPAGLSLSSGRILIPCYHGRFHWDDGTFTHVHMMYSDDNGKSWYLGMIFDLFNDPMFSNECQVVEVSPNKILVSARSLGPFPRVQSFSYDGGITFERMQSSGISQPTTGVEGSILIDSNKNRLLLSTLSDGNFLGIRYNLTIFESDLNGTNWKSVKVINPESSAYSAMTKLNNGSIGILYERSNKTNFIFQPDYITWEIIYK